jgi:DNA-binding transcriptional regulator GbsR (MarR family)
MARLRISRGGANQNLRALEEWRLVRRVHRPGDRRDYFEAEGEAWSVLWILVDERKRREVDPLIAVLRECLSEAPPADEAAARLYHDRLSSLLSLLEEMNGLYQRLHELLRDSSPEVLRQVARL